MEEPHEGKPPLPDSLFFSFRSECLRSDCDSVLKTWRNYLRIKKDSLRSYTLLNGGLENSFANGFRVERDSIHESIGLKGSTGSTVVEFASAYRFFANGDSLEINWSQGHPRCYGRSKDVLPPD